MHCLVTPMALLSFAKPPYEMIMPFRFFTTTSII
nr:MAG TPA: hypothetical protein [Caudoviricetes sp.]